MKKDPVIYLEHILDAMNAILRFTNEMQAQAFYEDDLVQSAVIRKFEVIGEAAKRIPEEFKAVNPEIPWKQMAGFRDVLIHNYDDLNMETIWETVDAYLPSAVKQIEKILNKL
ncbi:MAG: DUF86 domain-containing protein [Saprospiraceae bacterium]